MNGINKNKYWVHKNTITHENCCAFFLGISIYHMNKNSNGFVV